MSAGEVPLLQRSQAQGQAAPQVSDVLGVRQAQVRAGLPSFPAFHCPPFWKASRHPVCLVIPVSPKLCDSRCLIGICGVGGLFSRRDISGKVWNSSSNMRVRCKKARLEGRGQVEGEETASCSCGGEVNIENPRKTSFSALWGSRPGQTLTHNSVRGVHGEAGARTVC